MLFFVVVHVDRECAHDRARFLYAWRHFVLDVCTYMSVFVRVMCAVCLVVLRLYVWV